MSRHKALKKNAGLIVNRRKRKDESTLFPGYRLQEYVTGTKSGATLVGHIFEHATAKLVGTERHTTNGSADICPDGIDEERKLWVESKGTQRQHAFKICADQLDAYDKAQYEASVFEAHYQVLYCLWTYHEARVTKPRDWSTNCEPDVRIPTKEEFIRLVLGATRSVDVIDLSLMRRIRQCVEFEENEVTETCSVKDYASWAAYHDGRPYYVLNLGHGFLQRLRENPVEVLEELDIDPSLYRWQRHNGSPRSIVMDGMRFPLPKLDVFELVYKEGHVQHPEAKDHAPF